MIDFLKGTVGKDYFSDRLYGCQECIAEYLASKEPLSQPTNQSFTNRFIESRIIWIGSTAGIRMELLYNIRTFHPKDNIKKDSVTAPFDTKEII